MTLPTSPPLTLTQVLAEFGAPAGTPLSAMVRGGAYVPNIPQNSNVPTAPPVELLDFLGAANTPPVRIENHNIGSWTTGAAHAGYRLGADGVAYFHMQGVYSAYANEWLVAGAAGDYEVRATLLEGTLSTGTLNTWLSLDQNRDWGNSDGLADGVSQSGRLLIEIRSKATQLVLDSAEITITAERESDL